MNFFGVGIFEILAVLLLVAVIFGPGKLPEIAGQFGRAVRELREYARDFRDEYLTDFEEVREELVEQRFELQQLDTDIRDDVEGAEQDVRTAVRDAETMTEEALEAARDEGVPEHSATATATATAASQPAAQSVAQGGERGARRVRRRPVVRPRRAAAGDAESADASEPARPSNVISLNRRRRGITDAAGEEQ